MTPQDRAERVAHAMLAKDAATRAMGMTVAGIGPGHATLEMTLSPDHLNGHQTAHGGILFTLADSAFAFACNSYNSIVVAQTNTITYVSPGHPGERIRAEAREVARAGRSGIYDVTLTGADGRIIALFRGQSRQIPGQHFDETEETRNA